MDAYARLVRACEPAARRLGMLLAGDDGDDAVQDALVKGWHRLGGYRGDAPFRSWLLRIVANEARNRRRSDGRRAAREQRVAGLRLSPSAESTVLDEERRRALAAAVDALPSKVRDVVVCRHLLELSESETAAVLGLPSGTVKSRLSRGLDRLRGALEEEHD